MVRRTFVSTACSGFSFLHYYVIKLNALCLCSILCSLCTSGQKHLTGILHLEWTISAGQAQSPCGQKPGGQTPLYPYYEYIMTFHRIWEYLNIFHVNYNKFRSKFLNNLYFQIHAGAIISGDVVLHRGWGLSETLLSVDLLSAGTFALDSLSAYSTPGKLLGLTLKSQAVDRVLDTIHSLGRLISAADFGGGFANDLWKPARCTKF